jgi:hypothetical protein
VTVEIWLTPSGNLLMMQGASASPKGNHDNDETAVLTLPIYFLLHTAIFSEITLATSLHSNGPLLFQFFRFVSAPSFQKILA